MGEVVSRVEEDIKTAMRAREADRLCTLRMVLSEMKNAGIEKKGREGLTGEVASPADYLDDAETIKVLQGAVKRRKEAAELFEAGDRPELAAKEKAEAVIIGAYLPAGLGETELETLVSAAIAEVGAESPAQMGAVMKAVMPKIAGRADGKAVSAVVKRLLS